jgi:hypothetical protein
VVLEKPFSSIAKQQSNLVILKKIELTPPKNGSGLALL